MYLPNLNYNDQINDQINDEINDLGLPIIKTVKSNPGIKADKIYEILSAGDKGITLNMVRNSIRRRLGKYIELMGSRKTVMIQNYGMESPERKTDIHPFVLE